jgi:hypothetical protein
MTTGKTEATRTFPKHTVYDPDTEERRREYNDEFIQRIMNFGCPAGALMHGFILEGLRMYAEECIKAGPKKFDSGFMNGRAWLACAQFYLDELKEHQR